MIIAAAQTIPKDGNCEANIADHCRLAAFAASHGAQLVVFPELSLTGYVLETAREHSFTPADERLKSLGEASAKHNIIIIAGAPIALHTGLHIGVFIVFPDGSLSMYTKQFLHEGEEAAFVPGAEHNPLVELDGERISLAICADITHNEHAANAAQRDTTLYIAGIFYTPGGIAEGHTHLSEYARMYNMNVLMVNYGGPSLRFHSAGQSAFWTAGGALETIANTAGEELVIATKENNKWTAVAITATAAS